jgi:hypothetical protein
MNDEQMIWERYKLISEFPATLEFMGDDPEITDKLKPKFEPVQKSTPESRTGHSKSVRSDINAWTNQKAKDLMKSTVQTGTAKGLDKRRKIQGKPPLLWRLIDANLEQNLYNRKYIIQKSDLESLVEQNPQIKRKLTTPDGITVIMTPSGLDERSGMMAFSSWIRSHKCGHAILEHKRNLEINENINKIINIYHSLFIDSLEFAHSLKLENMLDSIKEEYPILSSFVNGKQIPFVMKHYTKNNKFDFYCKLFTFGSARNEELQISDKNEELVAQLMQTGRITLNKMIDEKTIQNYIQESDTHQHGENLLNIEEYIADQIDTAIENCIGDILYDIV